MPRPYSEEFMRFISTTDSKSLGVALGRACVKANLPLIQVSRYLVVSKVSLFNWFRGRGMRENMREKVETFLNIVERDLEAGILPVSSHKEAALYIKGVAENNVVAQ
jgi:hypothetical protein